MIRLSYIKTYMFLSGIFVIIFIIGNIMVQEKINISKNKVENFIAEEIWYDVIHLKENYIQNKKLTLNNLKYINYVNIVDSNNSNNLVFNNISQQDIYNILVNNKYSFFINLKNKFLKITLQKNLILQKIDQEYTNIINLVHFSLITGLLIFLTFSFFVIILYKQNKNKLFQYIKKHLNNDKCDKNFSNLDIELKKQKSIVLYKEQEELICLYEKNRKKIFDIIEKNEELINEPKTFNKIYMKDKMTGLYNREYLTQIIKKSWNNIGLALLDVAAFKNINDIYGIEIGNKLLLDLSNTLQKQSKLFNMELCRLNADEFAFFKTINSPNDEKLFIKNIIKIIKNIENKTFHIYTDIEEIKINIALHSGIAIKKKMLLESANIALTQAKLEKKDIVVFLDDLKKHNEKNKKQLELIKKINYGVRNYNFIPFLQPICDKNLNIIKYEALARLKINNEYISALHFIEFSKKIKLYKEITKQIYFHVFEFVKLCNKKVNINITNEDIISSDITNFIYDNLKEIDASLITFEIVESEEITNKQLFDEFLNNIRNYGASIAIDDFGSGYSSFSLILEMKPDYLKIDGSIIKNIHKDKNLKLITKGIIDFARNLNMLVVAEYIHNEEVFEICKELGVDLFQGFYCYEPDKISNIIKDI